MTVHLDPLPCWRHLPIKEVRRRSAALLREIERQAAAERRLTEKEVPGAQAVMAYDPHHRPGKLDRSPAPSFHARRNKVRNSMRDAYAWIVAEYRKAAERLRRGDRLAGFPEGTFPPGLPFVPFARGQPP
ncbi:MAG: hypothetical protein AAF657_30545 [Acidobacteriota bacterium]